METSKTEKQREQSLKNINYSEYGTYTRDITYMGWEYWNKKKKRQSQTGEIFETTMTENSLKLISDIQLWIQEAQKHQVG